MIHKTISLQDIDIITTLSDSKKSKVYLVSLKNSPDQFAILKKYQEVNMVDCFRRIESLKSEYFPEMYEMWEENGTTFLLEEYLPGETLQDKLDAEVLLYEKELSFYMLELCRALHVLHNAIPPIIHRDIKPENVIITESGKVKLLDFDASREYKEEQDRDTVLLGTKEYASPEQFGFMQTDIRSDIYSWGIVFSELLEHAQVSSDYNKKAKKIIDRATMFDPKKRYPDTSALMKDIQQLEQPDRLKRMWIACLSGLALIGIVCVTTWRGVEPTSEKPDSDVDIEQTDALESLETIQETLQESQGPQEISAEIAETGPAPLLDIESVEAVPLAEAYNYVSIEEEMQAKYMTIMETRSDLYYGFGFDDNDSGLYSDTQETVIGKEYVALRFLKAYPRDIVVQDDRFEGKIIDTVSYRRYLEDEGINDRRQFLEATDYSMEFGNVVSISADYLQTLEPGAYTFTIDTDDLGYGFYLIVHGEEERVDNFRVHTLNEIAYYSSESRNDVVFYVNNTPYPIQEVRVGNRVLSTDEYELVDEGFGVVLHPELLERYEELDGLELLIKTANGKLVGCRVIYLKHF